MPKLRVNAFSLSIDGYGAGPDQSLDNPLGVGGFALHEWAFGTRTFRKMFGKEGGSTGIDEDFAVRSFDNVGANILGRNMFGPVRGPWPDESWKGWWGDKPPYHTPVFVLTHHARAPIDDEGRHGIPFRHRRHRGRAAAGASGRRQRDVRLGGGVSTVRQYLQAGLIDELHLADLGRSSGPGEHVFSGLDLPKLGFAVSEHVPSDRATHVVLTRNG